ncbi:flavin reductase [Actinomadura rubrisoli]|uniref:Flavin reductase n=1 Tax=Actinomadura rubrisoli TaxID=2530368 RepID=A0A4R5AXV8_9ACTN|nr:flavin reductase [Actinomadura rubrisoli]
MRQHPERRPGAPVPPVRVQGRGQVPGARRSRRGLRVADHRDVVAWIDCDLESVQEAGDHFAVIGRVRELDVGSPSLPLLFFQGGYGRFAPLSLVASSGRGALIEQLREVDLVRAEMEKLASDLSARCIATSAEAKSAIRVIAVSVFGADGRVALSYPTRTRSRMRLRWSATGSGFYRSPSRLWGRAGEPDDSSAGVAAFQFGARKRGTGPYRWRCRQRDLLPIAEGHQPLLRVGTTAV